MSTSILVGGQPLVPPLVITADGVAFKQLTIVTTPANPGAGYQIVGAPVLIDGPAEGTLDGTGQASFKIGPSRMRGVVGLGVQVDREAQVSFSVKYA